VLPPRPIAGDPETAWQEIRKGFQGLAPFIVELQQVCLFEASDVLYLSVGAGIHELTRLHRSLNRGLAGSEEQFEYHPHVTLAQDLPSGQMAHAVDLARHRWKEYTGQKQFSLDRLTFVQNQLGRGWSDLAECELRPTVLV
jgi:2'-5' RNA ligase